MIHYLLESKKARFLYTFISLAIWIYFYIILQIEYLSFIGYGIVILLMIQSILLLLRAIIAKNSLLFVVFLFIFLYTQPAKLFFFNQLYLCWRNQLYTNDTVAYVTLIFSLFLITLNACLSLKRQYVNINNSFVPRYFKNNPVIFWFLIICSFICIILGKSGDNLLSGLGYSAGEREVSSINEYVLILFFLAYIYTNGEKAKRYILNILFIYYSIKNLLYGGRIEFTMLLFMLFMVRYQYKFSFRKILLFFLIGLWGMSILSTIRSNPMLVVNGNISAILKPSAKSKLDFQVSNEGDVYWASERMILFINEGELTAVDRLKAGGFFVLSAFFPAKKLSPLADLSSYKRNVKSTGGGGLAPIFVYVFWGFGGVIVLGIFLAFMFNKLNIIQYEKLNAQYVYLVLLITTLPRWFAYYPISLIKFCIWGVIGYFLISSLDYTLKKYCSDRNNKLKIPEQLHT